jgi:hypothetical protein
MKKSPRVWECEGFLFGKMSDEISTECCNIALQNDKK